jgi:hypothetical protein
MNSFPKDIILHIASSLFNHRKPNCTHQCIYTDILSFAYTCKYIYDIIIKWPTPWYNACDHMPNDMDPRHKLITLCHIFDTSVRTGTFCDISHLRSCRKLIMYDNINLIVTEQILSQLTHFSIFEANSQNMIRLINKMINLEKLHICNDETVYVSKFYNCTNLHTLMLCCCGHLCSYHLLTSFSKLRKLILSQCPTLRFIIKFIPQITYISVGTDVAIDEFFGHPSIQHIYYDILDNDSCHDNELPTTYTTIIFPTCMIMGNTYFPTPEECIKSKIPTLHTIQYRKKLWVSDIKYAGNLPKYIIKLNK